MEAELNGVREQLKAADAHNNQLIKQQRAAKCNRQPLSEHDADQLVTAYKAIEDTADKNYRHQMKELALHYAASKDPTGNMSGALDGPARCRRVSRASARNARRCARRTLRPGYTLAGRRGTGAYCAAACSHLSKNDARR